MGSPSFFLFSIWTRAGPGPADMCIISMLVNLHTHHVHVRRKKLKPQRDPELERVDPVPGLPFFVFRVAWRP